MLKKSISLSILLCFLINAFGPMPQANAQGVVDLPAPGSMLTLSASKAPVLMKGMIIHPESPFKFDFIMDTGHSNLKAGDAALKEESDRLVKYFLTALTIPEQELWVNLSPYEKDRMVPDALGQTEMGRDMLAQDYILKQLTASLIYPEKDLGKSFWDKVYAESKKRFGTTSVPVNTFNKVWIVADKADVYEHNNAAYITGAHLKVMLEEDYLAISKNANGAGPVTNGNTRYEGAPAAPRPSSLSLRSDEGSASGSPASVASQIVREIVLPAIEKEVNEGNNFAPLRQMFYSMILASWFKMALKDALVTKVYSNKSKVNAGVTAADIAEKDQIYARYLQAFKKGVFNYIKDPDPADAASGEKAPRKYFSGGLRVMKPGMVKRSTVVPPEGITGTGSFAMSSIQLQGAKRSASLAMAAFALDNSRLGQVTAHLDGVIDEQMKLASNDFRRRFGQVSFLPEPTGNERGLSIGFDHSGTNARAILLYIDDNGKEHILSETKSEFGERIMNASSAEIFDFVAEMIAKLIGDASYQMSELGIDSKNIPLGYSFAFPINQSGLTVATFNEINRGIKEWSFPDLHKKDIATWIRKALDRRGLSNVQVRAIVNDTVATQLSTFVTKPDGRLIMARIGMIVGTGFNFSFIDPVTGQVLNAEAGGLDIPEKLKEEEDLQYLSSLPELSRKNLLEKLITGEAPPALIKLRMKNLADVNELFQGLTPDNRAKIFTHLEKENEIFRFRDGVLSTNGDVDLMIGYMKSIDAQINISTRDAQRIYETVDGVYDRSAQLVAYLTAKALSLSDPLNENLSKDGMILPIDGSVFWKVQGYKEMVVRHLESAQPDLSGKIKFYDEQMTPDTKLVDLVAPGNLVIVRPYNASARGSAMGALAVSNALDSLQASVDKKSEAMTAKEIVKVVKRAFDENSELFLSNKMKVRIMAAAYIADHPQDFPDEIGNARRFLTEKIEQLIWKNNGYLNYNTLLAAQMVLESRSENLNDLTQRADDIVRRVWGNENHKSGAIEIILSNPRFQDLAPSVAPYIEMRSKVGLPWKENFAVIRARKNTLLSRFLGSASYNVKRFFYDHLNRISPSTSGYEFAYEVIDLVLSLGDDADALGLGDIKKDIPMVLKRMASSKSLAHQLVSAILTDKYKLTTPSQEPDAVVPAPVRVEDPGIETLRVRKEFPTRRGPESLAMTAPGQSNTSFILDRILRQLEKATVSDGREAIRVLIYTDDIDRDKALPLIRDVAKKFDVLMVSEQNVKKEWVTYFIKKQWSEVSLPTVGEITAYLQPKKDRLVEVESEPSEAMTAKVGSRISDADFNALAPTQISLSKDYDFMAGGRVFNLALFGYEGGDYLLEITWSGSSSYYYLGNGDQAIRLMDRVVANARLFVESNDEMKQDQGETKLAFYNRVRQKVLDAIEKPATATVEVVLSKVNAFFNERDLSGNRVNLLFADGEGKSESFYGTFRFSVKEGYGSPVSERKKLAGEKFNRVDVYQYDAQIDREKIKSVEDVIAWIKNTFTGLSFPKEMQAALRVYESPASAAMTISEDGLSVGVNNKTIPIMTVLKVLQDIVDNLGVVITSGKAAETPDNTIEVYSWKKIASVTERPNAVTFIMSLMKEWPEDVQRLRGVGSEVYLKNDETIPVIRQYLGRQRDAIFALAKIIRKINLGEVVLDPIAQRFMSVYEFDDMNERTIKAVLGGLSKEVGELNIKYIPIQRKLIVSAPLTTREARLKELAKAFFLSVDISKLKYQEAPTATRTITTPSPAMTAEITSRLNAFFADKGNTISVNAGGEVFVLRPGATDEAEYTYEVKYERGMTRTVRLNLPNRGNSFMKVALDAFLRRIYEGYYINTYIPAILAGLEEKEPSSIFVDAFDFTGDRQAREYQERLNKAIFTAIAAENNDLFNQHDGWWMVVYGDKGTPKGIQVKGILVEEVIKILREKSELIAKRAFQSLDTPEVKAKSEPDRAALSLPPGGIDLNRDKMAMQVTRDGEGTKVTVDPAMLSQLQSPDFNGFEFTTERIIAVPNIYPLLGLQ